MFHVICSVLVVGICMQAPVEAHGSHQSVNPSHYASSDYFNRKGSRHATVAKVTANNPEIQPKDVCQLILMDCLRKPGLRSSSREHHVKKCLKKVLRLDECKSEKDLRSEFNEVKDKHHHRDKNHLIHHHRHRHYPHRYHHEKMSHKVVPIHKEAPLVN